MFWKIQLEWAWEEFVGLGDEDDLGMVLPRFGHMTGTKVPLMQLLFRVRHHLSDMACVIILQSHLKAVWSDSWPGPHQI